VQPRARYARAAKGLGAPAKPCRAPSVAVWARVAYRPRGFGRIQCTGFMRVIQAGALLLVGWWALPELARAQHINLDGKVTVEGEKRSRAKKSSNAAKPKAKPKPKPKPKPKAKEESPPAADATEAATAGGLPAGEASVAPAPTPAPAPVAPVAVSVPEPVPPAPPSPAPEPPPASPVELALFVDAYVAWQSSGSGSLATLSGHRAFSGQGANLRAENGFSLAFLGLDASYQTQYFGATANVRFGEGAPLYHVPTEGESGESFGVELLSQAYLSVRPIEPLGIDLGMFSTPFGAEVLESWKNLNYTRGALYYYAQPAWHTGLRLKWDVNEALSATAFVANGSNNLSETQQLSGLDQTPTVGVQLAVSPWPALSLAAGGLFTLDSYHNDDAGFDALADLIVTLELGDLRAILNGDYILTRNAAPNGGDRNFLGVSAAVGCALAPAFAVAARGELLLDDANFDGGRLDRWQLFTATLVTTAP
jgi:hypothetical protein